MNISAIHIRSLALCGFAAVASIHHATSVVKPDRAIPRTDFNHGLAQLADSCRTIVLSVLSARSIRGVLFRVTAG